MIIRGKVEATSEKEFGETTIYSVKINGEYYTGFNKPKCKQGDLIELEFIEREKDGKKYKNFMAIEVIESGKDEKQEAIDKGLRKKMATYCTLEAARLMQKEKINKADFKDLKSLAKELLKVVEEIANEDI